MGKKNKPANFSKLNIPNDNVYLNERGGISVIYESDNSEEGIQHLLENEEITLGETNLISIAADLHPYNIIMQGKNDNTIGTNFALPRYKWGKTMKMTSNFQVLDNHNQQVTLDYNTPMGSNITKQVSSKQESSPENMGKIQQQGFVKNTTNLAKNLVEMGEPSSKATKKDSQILEIPTTKTLAGTCNDKQLHPLEEQMQEYDDEQYDYEYNDLLMDELADDNNPNKVNIEAQPIMISDDPLFSEKDLEEFTYNEPIEIRENLDLSEGNFHSLQNSINSSSSFVNGMERLIVHQPNQSNSTSSKRKIMEGIEDTATSEAREGKRSKI